MTPHLVIPAKAEIQTFFFAPLRLRVKKKEVGFTRRREGREGRSEESWIPAFAGMTGVARLGQDD
jgi:hypothetical protein